MFYVLLIGSNPLINVLENNMMKTYSTHGPYLRPYFPVTRHGTEISRYLQGRIIKAFDMIRCDIKCTLVLFILRQIQHSMSLIHFSKLYFSMRETQWRWWNVPLTLRYSIGSARGQIAADKRNILDCNSLKDGLVEKVCRCTLQDCAFNFLTNFIAPWDTVRSKFRSEL